MAYLNHLGALLLAVGCCQTQPIAPFGPPPAVDRAVFGQLSRWEPQPLVDVRLIGDTLVTTGAGGRVRSWTAEGRLDSEVNLGARVVAISPTGDARLVVRDGRHVIWDVAGDAARAHLERSLSGPAAFSPDGRLIAAPGAETWLFQASDGAWLRSLPLNAPVWSPDGHALCGCGAGKAWTVHSATGAETVGPGPVDCRGVGWTPSGLAAAGTRALLRYNRQLQPLGAPIALPADVEAMAVAPDGQEVAVALGGATPSLALVSLKTGAVRTLPALAMDVGTLRFLGPQWILATGDSRFALFSRHDGTWDAPSHPGGLVGAVWLDSDVVTLDRVPRLTRRSPRGTIRWRKNVSGDWLSGLGPHLITRNQGQFTVHDADSGVNGERLSPNWVHHDTPPAAAARSTLAVGDNGVRLYRLSGGNLELFATMERSRMEDHGRDDDYQGLDAVALSPDASKVAGLVAEGGAWLWDVQSRQVLTTSEDISGHLLAATNAGVLHAYNGEELTVGARVALTSANVTRLTVHGDHAYVADGDMLVSLATGANTRRPSGHQGRITSLSVRGDRILTASEDGTARILRR